MKDKALREKELKIMEQDIVVGRKSSGSRLLKGNRWVFSAVSHH